MAQSQLNNSINHLLASIGLPIVHYPHFYGSSWISLLVTTAPFQAV